MEAVIQEGGSLKVQNKKTPLKSTLGQIFETPETFVRRKK
jgi:hypothetical protein